MNIDSPEFGTEVYERLYRLNITQTELAEKLGISVQYLNDILKGKRLSRRRREQIAKFVEAKPTQQENKKAVSMN